MKQKLFRCQPLLAALSVVIWTQGCSDNPSDKQQVPRVFAAAFCDAMRGCCVGERFDFDEEACVAQVAAHPPFFTWKDPGDKSVYDPNEMARCTETLKQLEGRCVTDPAVLYSASDFESSYQASLWAACRNVVKGLVAPWQPCEHGSDCAVSGPRGYAHCLASQDAPSTRLCHSFTLYGGIGDECVTDILPACERGGICMAIDGNPMPGLGRPGTCKPFRAIGEDCETPVNSCVDDGYCDSSSQKCVPAISPGERCDTPAPCTRHHQCWNGTCVALPPAREDGQSCTSLLNCKSDQCKAGQCIPRNYEYLISRQTCRNGPWANR